MGVRTLTCPYCVKPMETFKALARDKGPPIELDRCRQCERVWFDVPEIERAVGKQYLSRLEGIGSPHRCPACAASMNEVLVNGEITVEQCTGCKGALVDPAELKTLSGGPLVEAVPPIPPRRKLAKSSDSDYSDIINELIHSLFG
jgi:Zn-finger nucleic acid-binding protein